MAIRPLGHRILIQPDTPPAQTDSGLILPSDRDHVPVSGVIIAVGDGPARDARIRKAAILRCRAIVDELAHSTRTSVEVSQFASDAAIEMGRYLNQCERFDSLKVGDRVVYAVESGLAITEDGRDYIILNEDDAVVIDTEAESAA